MPTKFLICFSEFISSLSLQVRRFLNRLLFTCRLRTTLSVYGIVASIFSIPQIRM